MATASWKELRSNYKELERQKTRQKFSRFQRVIVWCLLYLFNMVVAGMLLLWICHVAAVAMAAAALRLIIGGIRHEISLRDNYATENQRRD